MAAVNESADMGQAECIKTVVTIPHQATDSSQLELKVNDIVYVLEQDQTGWWGGFKESEEQTGWFPGSCVRLLPSDAGAMAAAGEQQEQSAWQPSKGSPTRLSSAALETDGRAVASPMRGGNAGSPPADARLLAEQESAARALDAENARLKKENAELAQSMTTLKRQSDVNRHTLEKLETEAEQERQKVKQMESVAQQERERREQLEREVQAQRAQLERELQAQKEEQRRLASQAASLQDQLLASERRASGQGRSLEAGQKDLAFGEREGPRCSLESLAFAGELVAPGTETPLYTRSAPRLPPSGPSGAPASTSPGMPAQTSIIDSASRPFPAPMERLQSEKPARGLVADKVTQYSSMAQQKAKQRSASCSTFTRDSCSTSMVEEEHRKASVQTATPQEQLPISEQRGGRASSQGRSFEAAQNESMLSERDCARSMPRLPPSNFSGAPSAASAGIALGLAQPQRANDGLQLQCSAPSERPQTEEPTRGIVAEKVTLFSSIVQKNAKQRSASCSTYMRDSSGQQPREARGCSRGPAERGPMSSSPDLASRNCRKAPHLDLSSLPKTEVFFGMSPMSRSQPQ